jgi:hypothetical protein
VYESEQSGQRDLENVSMNSRSRVNERVGSYAWSQILADVLETRQINHFAVRQARELLRRAKAPQRQLESRSIDG